MSRRIAMWTGLALVLMVLASILTACSGGSANAADSSSSTINVVVLCSSCGIPGKDRTPHLILLDQNTGDVWAYEELDQQPAPLGKLTRVGEPLQKAAN
jgi:hypothetical protein